MFTSYLQCNLKVRSQINYNFTHDTSITIFSILVNTNKINGWIIKIKKMFIVILL